MTAMNEEEAIKLRLTSDEKTLKRAAKAFYELAAAAAAGGENLESAYTGFLLELQQFELASRKALRVQAMNANEASDFVLTQQRIDEQIKEAEADIERLKEQLELERKVRENKLLYNAEAEKIVKLPDRRASALAKEQVLEETAQLQEDLQRAERLLAWRTRQVRAAYWATAMLQEEMGVDPTDPTRPPELYYLRDLAPSPPAGADAAAGAPAAMEL